MTSTGVGTSAPTSSVLRRTPRPAVARVWSRRLDAGPERVVGEDVAARHRRVPRRVGGQSEQVTSRCERANEVGGVGAVLVALDHDHRERGQLRAVALVDGRVQGVHEVRPCLPTLQPEPDRGARPALGQPGQAGRHPVSSGCLSRRSRNATSVRDTAGVSAPSGHVDARAAVGHEVGEDVVEVVADPRALASTSCWLGVSSAERVGQDGGVEDHEPDPAGEEVGVDGADHGAVADAVVVEPLVAHG